MPRVRRRPAAARAAGIAGYAPCRPDEQAGFALGFWVELPVVDMRRYLPYLVQRLTAHSPAIRTCTRSRGST